MSSSRPTNGLMMYAPALAASSACAAREAQRDVDADAFLAQRAGGHDPVARQRTLHHDILVDLGQLSPFGDHRLGFGGDHFGAEMSPSTMSQIMRPAPRSAGLPWRSARGWSSRRRRSPSSRLSSTRPGLPYPERISPSIPPPASSVSAPGNGTIEEVPAKTFYIETFGCQMNAHDSEKVIGTLVAAGLRAGGDARRRRTWCSTTPAASATRPSRRSSTGCRISSASRQGQDVRRAGMRGAAGRREDLRARAARQPGVRLGQLHPAAARCWCNWKRATGASPDSAWIPKRPSTRRSRAATIRTAPTSPSSKAATNPAPIAWCRSRAGRSAAAPARA